MLPDLLFILNTLGCFRIVCLYRYTCTATWEFTLYLLVKSTVLPKMASVSVQSFCLSLSSVGITERNHHTWLHRNFIMTVFPLVLRDCHWYFSKDYIECVDHFSIDILAVFIHIMHEHQNISLISTVLQFLLFVCVCVCVFLCWDKTSYDPGWQQYVAQATMFHFKSSFNSVLKCIPRCFP